MEDFIFLCKARIMLHGGHVLLLSLCLTPASIPLCPSPPGVAQSHSLFVTVEYAFSLFVYISVLEFHIVYHHI